MHSGIYAYEKIAQLEREDLERKLNRISRYNLFPAEDKKTRGFGKLSLALIFLRNVIIK